MDPWEEYAANPPPTSALAANPWDEYAQTAQGPQPVGNTIPLPTQNGPPVSQAMWNPLTKENARQVPAQLMQGVLSPVTLGLDLAAKGINKVAGTNLPMASEGLKNDLAQVFGQPDPSLAGQIGNGMLQIGAGAASPISNAVRAAIAGKFTPAAATVRQGIMSNAQDLGYTLPPSYAGSGYGAQALEKLVGSGPMATAANYKNQPVTDMVGRQIVGLAPNSNITPKAVLDQASNVASQTYEPLAKLGTIYNSPTYFQDLQQAVAPFVKAEKFSSGTGDQRIASLYSDYAKLNFNSEGLTQTLTNLRDRGHTNLLSDVAGNKQLGQAQLGVAQAIENSVQANLQNPASAISRNLMAQGNNSADMLNNYVEGRKKLAQIYAVHDAVTADGHINPQVLANNMNSSWTGPLQTMGQFSAAAPRISNYTTVPSGTLMGMTGPERTVAGAGLMGVMKGDLGLAPAALAAAAGGRAGLRNLMLSRPGQAMFASTNGGLLGNPAVQNSVPAFILNSGLFNQQQK